MKDASTIAYEYMRGLCPDIQERMNQFAERVLLTREGRIGSGMGGLLEALWGFMANETLEASQLGYEIGWFPNNQYNDFSCLVRDTAWDQQSRKGELFRIEAKSMNRAADESKGHFDALKKELEQNDSILILVWEWSAHDKYRSFPKVVDTYFGRASYLATLRDKLHEERGGTFVSRDSCPDHCPSNTCPHDGEPLNANGHRERSTGPVSCKGPNAGHAANFGGLVRMLKTNSNSAKAAFQWFRQNDSDIEEFIGFMFSVFPNEEKNHYGIDDFRSIATSLSIDYEGVRKDDLYSMIKARYPKSCITPLRYC